MASEAFKTHGLVPDEIDVPPPTKLHVKYLTPNKEVNLGAELTPTEVKETPEVKYAAESGAFYTLAMVDPDAPSRKEPSKRSVMHWLVGNIPGSAIEKGETIGEYIGSGAPEGSGLHRYAFLLYKQPGKINFGEQYRSANHVTTRFQFSIRDFAKKHNLGNPIAGNFFQAQFDDWVPIFMKQFTS